MNTPSHDGKKAAPTPEALREQVERTRDELGTTVEALAAKADVKAHAKVKAAEIKEQAVVVTDGIRESTAHAARLVKDKTPDPVLDKASQAAAQVHDTATRVGRLAVERTPEPVREKAGAAAILARGKRAPLIGAATALVAVLLLRRSRRRR